MDESAGIQDPQPVEMVSLVREITADADFEASGRNCHVHFQASDPQITVAGNVKLLHSAAENVVRNAVRHTHEGTVVEVTVNREVIENRNSVVIQVRDHGTARGRVAQRSPPRCV